MAKPQPIYNRTEILAQYDLVCKEVTPLLVDGNITQGLSLLQKTIKKYPLLKKRPEFWTNHKQEVDIFSIRGGFSEELRSHYFYFDYDLDEEDGLLDLYLYYIDSNHWICYSSPYTLRPFTSDETLAMPIYTQGKWYVCNENGDDPFWNFQLTE